MIAEARCARARYIDTGIKYHHHRRHSLQPRAVGRRSSVAAAITRKIKRGAIKRAERAGSSFLSQTSPTFVGNSIMPENIPKATFVLGSLIVARGQR